MPPAVPRRTTIFRATGVLAAALAVAAFGTGCGSGGGADTVNAATGPEVFKAANCSSCHTLAASGATGVIGPNLDGLQPDAATVERFVTSGKGSMPSFKDRLTPAQITAVAEYVARATKQ